MARLARWLASSRGDKIQALRLLLAICLSCCLSLSSAQAMNFRCLWPGQRPPSDPKKILDWVDHRQVVLPTTPPALTHTMPRAYLAGWKTKWEQAKTEEQKNAMLREWVSVSVFAGVWTKEGRAFAINAGNRSALQVTLDPKAKFVRIGRINREEFDWTPEYEAWCRARGYRGLKDAGNAFNFTDATGNNFAERLSGVRRDDNAPLGQGKPKLPMLGDKRFLDENNIAGYVFDDGGTDSYVVVNWSLVRDVKFP